MSFWGLPLGDWQFWAVSAAALAGAWLALRPLVAAKRKPSGGACSNCALGARTVHSSKATNDSLVSLGRNR